MIDGGILLIILGITLMFMGPLERAWAHRKIERSALAPAFATSFPVVPPDPALEQLAERADDAVAHAPLAFTPGIPFPPHRR